MYYILQWVRTSFWNSMEQFQFPSVNEVDIFHFTELIKLKDLNDAIHVYDIS